jgi:DNA-binding beta-propeller fold protein YncE
MPNNKDLWISQPLNNLLIELNASDGSIIKKLNNFKKPAGLAASPSGNVLAVVEFGANDVAILNPATYSTIDRDPLGTGPITAPAQNVVMGLESGNTLFFTDALHGWKVDNTGAILRTLDGGHSWVDSYSGPYSVDGLDFINSSVGWATLSSPLDPNSSYTTETINPNNIELIYTTDGGQS